jgi:hypothetical protein
VQPASERLQKHATNNAEYFFGIDENQKTRSENSTTIAHGRVRLLTWILPETSSLSHNLMPKAEDLYPARNLSFTVRIETSRLCKDENGFETILKSTCTQVFHSSRFQNGTCGNPPQPRERSSLGLQKAITCRFLSSEIPNAAKLAD